MNNNALFINTLKDLQGKINSNDHYEILMAVALLRKLLIDGDPLVNKVNKNLRQKIEFTVSDRSMPMDTDGLTFWSIQDGFDPETSIPHLSKPIRVNKDGLLKRSVILINSKLITVLDLIKFLSHVQGAVHSGSPKDDKDKLLKNAEKNLTVGGMPAGLRSIKAIGRVVLKGLDPLRRELSQNQNYSDIMGLD